MIDVEGIGTYTIITNQFRPTINEYHRRHHTTREDIQKGEDDRLLLPPPKPSLIDT